MILIPKVLKRKDASSVVVAIVLAMILGTAFQMWSMPLSNEIIDNGYGYGGQGWKQAYLSPAVSALLQVVFLEVVLWLLVFAKGAMKSK